MQTGRARGLDVTRQREVVGWTRVGGVDRKTMLSRLRAVEVRPVTPHVRIRGVQGDDAFPSWVRVDAGNAVARHDAVARIHLSCYRCNPD